VRTILLWSAMLLAATAVALLLTILAANEIEDAWNIVVVSELFGLLRLTFLLTLAHAVALGLPLFIFLRSKSWTGIIACALGGFIIGAAGPVVLGLSGIFGNSSYNAWSGGKATVVNGAPTLAGWLEYAQNAGFVGLIGVGGGLTFWLIMRLAGQIPPTQSVAETPGRTSPTIAQIIAAAAISASCAVLLLPSIVKDRSCHNPFRGGRSSISPQIYASLNLTAEDWPELSQAITDFASANSLSFRSDQQTRSGQLLWRSLDLCNETGVHIEILDQPWLDRTSHAPAAIKGIKVSVEELRAGSGWKLLARDMIDKINARWPEKLLFRGQGGGLISEAEALNGRQ